MTRTPALRRLLALLTALGLLAAACGGSSDDAAEETTDESTEETAEETSDDTADDDAAEDDMDDEDPADDMAMAGDLSKCPNPLVIQTDWFPESEHGAVYNLMAGEGSVDPSTGRFTGPLAADPSLDIEIRAGGPFMGDQQTIAVMATDPDVFLGYVNTDEAINSYEEFPSIAVAAPLDINPQMVMWDPETYTVDSWEDVGASEATILVFAGGTYQEYLVGTGLISEGQLDSSYDGSPTRFIAEGGAVMQQGFITQEPYNYENVFTEWGKPVESILVHDSGFELYQGALTILKDKLDDDARSCLTAFVPLVQQSIVDFQADPTATNEAIYQAVVDIDSFWQLTPEGMVNTVELMSSLNIVGNGPNDTVGDFDMDRITSVIDALAESVPSISVPEGITAEDIATNEFIDPSIGL